MPCFFLGVFPFKDFAFFLGSCNLVQLPGPKWTWPLAPHSSVCYAAFERPLKGRHPGSPRLCCYGKSLCPLGCESLAFLGSILGTSAVVEGTVEQWPYLGGHAASVPFVLGLQCGSQCIMHCDLSTSLQEEAQLMSWSLLMYLGEVPPGRSPEPGVRKGVVCNSRDVEQRTLWRIAKRTRPSLRLRVESSKLCALWPASSPLGHPSWGAGECFPHQC